MIKARARSFDSWCPKDEARKRRSPEPTWECDVSPTAWACVFAMLSKKSDRIALSMTCRSALRGLKMRAQVFCIEVPRIVTEHQRAAGWGPKRTEPTEQSLLALQTIVRSGVTDHSIGVLPNLRALCVYYNGDFDKETVLTEVEIITPLMMAATVSTAQQRASGTVSLEISAELQDVTRIFEVMTAEGMDVISSAAFLRVLPWYKMMCKFVIRMDQWCSENSYEKSWPAFCTIERLGDRDDIKDLKKAVEKHGEQVREIVKRRNLRFATWSLEDRDFAGKPPKGFTKEQYHSLLRYGLGFPLVDDTAILGWPQTVVGGDYIHQRQRIREFREKMALRKKKREEKQAVEEAAAAAKLSQN